MNILELAILKKMVGGGSGTDNYNDLSNLPQINSETLAGNKTAENLGLQDALTFDSAPTEDSTNPVESGGVYNALAGKQDNLTFDDDPTENSTNPVKSGGVYSALAGKQDNLTFDGVYNASTNKAATESTVTNAIAGLDVSAFSVDADETISSISETDGKVSVTKQDIAIASNQVVAMTGYTKPSSAPATPAIQTSDTANQAFGKLEFKVDTNQSNILYGLNKGTKNCCQIITESVTVRGITITPQADGTLVLNGTNTSSSDTILLYDIKNASSSSIDYAYPTDFSIEKNVDYVLKGTGSTTTVQVQIAQLNDSSDLTTVTASGDGDKTFTITKNYVVIRLWCKGSATLSNVKIYPFVCKKSIYDQDSSFVPYGAPNYDLTRLEAEDRAALAEVVDSGAKNELQPTWTTQTINGVTFTVGSDGVITATTTGTRTGAVIYKMLSRYSGTKMVGKVMSISPPGGSGSTYYVAAEQADSPYRNVGEDMGDGVVISSEANNKDINVNIVIPANYSPNNLKFSPMLCTKAAFGVSNKFVPYRPNYDLVAKAVNAANLYGEFAASTSITFESSLALVTIKRNDSNADNVAVYVVANLRDGLTYKPIISSENIPVTIAKDSNNSKNVKITNNGSAYYFYLISRYPSANI